MPAMSHTQHRADAPSRIGVAVLTVSDTRTLETDTAGLAIVRALESAGHVVVAREIATDDPDLVSATVRGWLGRDDIRVVITTGGTGVTSRDSTFEALAGLFQKRLDGFGELFRMLSYQDIGPAAMLSRACAGTIGRTAVFVLPGSEAAVRLALDKLLLPELGHIVRELSR